MKKEGRGESETEEEKDEKKAEVKVRQRKRFRLGRWIGNNHANIRLNAFILSNQSIVQ
jgi:hypothetical protein